MTWIDRSKAGTVIGLLLCCWCHAKSGNLAANGGFEEIDRGRAVGWSGLWTREPGKGQAQPDDSVKHSGNHSVRIEHSGSQDWSLACEKRLDVNSGDIFTIQGWVRTKGPGSATIGVIAYDESGKAVDWTLGGRSATAAEDWRLLRSRFLIPHNVATIHPRLIGYGPATVWLDDFSLVKEGNVARMRSQGAPERLTLENAIISLSVDTGDASLTVTDKRTGRTWRQQSSGEVAVLGIAKTAGNIEMTLLDGASGMDVRANIKLASDKAEFTVTLSAKGELEAALRFPNPFVTEAGTSLVVPMNEGISYPVEDHSIDTMRLVAYGGHGICMPFWGVSDGSRAHMAIIETPDDACINIKRIDEKLCIALEWDSQKGQFGYARRLRYVFFDKGGHVAICKRYRQYAKENGLLKTLREKRRENPNVDLLIGAVNVWCWDSDALEIVREMTSAGIERILWSNRKPPEVIKAMNEMAGVLTSRYDIYQDLMDPQVVKDKLWGSHADWTQAGWPDDLMLDAAGNRRKGWQVRGKDGQMYPCGVLCDKQALKYARQRVPEELKTHPYRCRFIDTTTASPWRECCHPDHPMTRSESRHWRMELLRYVSEDMKLVTGSETGHDAAVPFVHYFEGMLSLGYYRVPDSGRNMNRILDEVPQRVAKFQVGHEYRLPLWELVYHDCVVAQWYWGDYNNKLLAIWDKRDLFNLLYGTPPMFMFKKEYWRENKDRFAQSYKDTCPFVRQVGYSEMTNHEFLTPDRAVQQTTFANGFSATVNFGDKPYSLPNGKEIKPMGYYIRQSK
ncbi:MAG: carbohydrate binding domain-containing protein [Sedimentisphaerales bacterium]|nr:carbohydrate binding domain-containing protein [Sedimentisphaerales bacterium]